MSKTPEKRRSPLGQFYGRRLDRPMTNEESALLKNTLPNYRVNEHTLENWLKKTDGQRKIEIGFGGGEHLISNAKNETNTQFLGIEPFVSGCVKALKDVVELDLKNVSLCQEDAKLILTKLPESVIDEIYVMFADPWPKTRHHKRRIINEFTLAEMRRVLKPNGTVKIATDHPGYYEWITEHLAAVVERKWFNMLFDVATRPQNWPPTRYEQKALTGGATCHYIQLGCL